MEGSMADVISSTAFQQRVWKLGQAVNEPHFARTEAAFKRYSDKQRPGLRRKMRAYAAACRRLDISRRAV
jgi:hypothetical protein